MGLRGGLADDAAYLGGAGEGDLVDAGMLNERLAGARVAGKHIEHAGGQSRLHGQLGEGQSGERRIFRRLDDHRIARG